LVFVSGVRCDTQRIKIDLCYLPETKFTYAGAGTSWFDRMEAGYFLEEGKRGPFLNKRKHSHMTLAGPAVPARPAL
jgi:hypothetical protein